MERLIFRSYKQSTGGEQVAEWHNSYVLECDYSLTDDQCNTDALNIARAESTLHRSDTTFYRMSVGIYGNQADGTHDVTERSFPLTRYNLTGQILVKHISPPTMGLLMKKQVNGGRNGQALFLGSLNKEDYNTNDAGEITLLNVGDWQYRLDWLFKGLYWSQLAGTLVVPQLATGQQTAWDYKPGEWYIGHAVKAQARYKAQFKRKGAAVGMYGQASGIAWLSAVHLQAMREEYALGHDFQPKEFMAWTQAIINGASELADSIHTWLENGEPDDNGQTTFIVPRFGPDAHTMSTMAEAIPDRADQDVQELAKIKVYDWFDGQQYYHLEATHKFIEFATIWLAKIEELADFDFLSPYYMADNTA